MVVYRGNPQDQNTGGTYVEIAPVRRMGSDYVPLSAVPLSKTGLKRLKEIVDADNSTIQVKRQLCPPNVLFYDFAYGARTVCWHMADRRRLIVFDPKTEIGSGVVTMPRMIFHTNGTHLKVFCYRSTIRPKASTELFHAPFMNTSVGSVCLGMNQLSKSVDLSDIMKRAEAVFFEAPFTHESGGVYKNMKELWQNAIKTGKFDEGKLIKSQQTVQSLL